MSFFASLAQSADAFRKSVFSSGTGEARKPSTTATQEKATAPSGPGGAKKGTASYGKVQPNQ